MIIAWFIPNKRTLKGLKKCQNLGAIAIAIAQITIGRLAEPEEVEIGRIVAFLAADEAGYITGADFSINGELIYVLELSRISNRFLRIVIKSLSTIFEN